MAKYIDMEANITVSLAAEILGRKPTSNQTEADIEGNNKQLNK